MINSSHFIHPLRSLAFSSAAICLFFGLPSCREKAETPEDNTTDNEPIEKLYENGLTKDVSSLISSQTSSKIHWQFWDKNLFAQAKGERKTIIALIGSGTDANTHDILNQLNASAATVNLLNQHHVNVLIDSNVHPDLEFFAAMLCINSRTQVSTPLIVWFSYEGNPISWTPVSPRTTKNIDELVSRMSNTVYQMWRDDPEYVLKNSRKDLERRMQMVTLKAPEGDAVVLTSRAIRQAASLFDPTSESIDGIGKLSPARYIDLLLQASRGPQLLESQKRRYIKNATIAADSILLHGLVDPLDGGVYSGIKKTTSALPIFSKTLQSQAYTMQALYSLYQITGHARYLEAADSIASYIETNFTLPDGGYRVGIINAFNAAQNNPCVWTLEEIEQALTPEETRIATLAFGLKGLGNIPLVDDPDRSYFRKNTIAWKVSPSELAKQLSLEPTELGQSLESITKKLAKLRTERSGKGFTENLSLAGPTALYVSASVRGYRASTKPAHLLRAQKAMNHIKKNFLDSEGNLLRARHSGSLGTQPAMGSDYTLVVQAALDLHEATLDPAWLKFAHDLHKRMNSLLADEELTSIEEYGGSDQLQSYRTKIYFTLPALDNPNTWALAYSNAKRLNLRVKDDTLITQATTLDNTLLGLASGSTIGVIDYLTAKATLSQRQVYLKKPVSEELLSAALKKPCQIILVSSSNLLPEFKDQIMQLNPGQAIVISDSKIIGTASSPAELDALTQ